MHQWNNLITSTGAERALAAPRAPPRAEREAHAESLIVPSLVPRLCHGDRVEECVFCWLLAVTMTDQNACRLRLRQCRLSDDASCYRQVHSYGLCFRFSMNGGAAPTPPDC